AIEWDMETSFSRHLKSKDIVLTFNQGSTVYEMLGKATTYRLLPEHIIPYKNLRPSLIAKNLVRFRDTCKKLGASGRSFESRFGQVMSDMNGSIGHNKLGSSQKSQFSNAFINSFEMVRYGFNMSVLLRKTDRNIPPEYKDWFEATGEDARSVLTSKLFETALAFVEKTVFAYHSVRNDRCSLAFQSSVRELRNAQREYLTKGSLIVPPAEAFQAMRQSMVELIEKLDLFPVAALPGLVELETNRSFFIPLVIWNAIKADMYDELGERGVQRLSLASSSRTLYLTDADLNIFFADPARREMFSYRIIDALERVSGDYDGTRMRRFLGYGKGNDNGSIRTATAADGNRRSVNGNDSDDEAVQRIVDSVNEDNLEMQPQDRNLFRRTFGYIFGRESPAAFANPAPPYFNPINQSYQSFGRNISS
ncbi:MAG: hypothetical protein AAGE99_02375, partial [Chlamydiota bacterium]